MLKNKNFDVNEAFYNELDKGQKQYLVAQDVSKPIFSNQIYPYRSAPSYKKMEFRFHQMPRSSYSTDLTVEPTPIESHIPSL